MLLLATSAKSICASRGRQNPVRLRFEPKLTRTLARFIYRLADIDERAIARLEHSKRTIGKVVSHATYSRCSPGSFGSASIETSWFTHTRVSFFVSFFVDHRKHILFLAFSKALASSTGRRTPAVFSFRVPCVFVEARSFFTISICYALDFLACVFTSCLRRCCNHFPVTSHLLFDHIWCC